MATSHPTEGLHSTLILPVLLPAVVSLLLLPSSSYCQTPPIDGCTITKLGWVQKGLDKIFWGACSEHDACYRQCNPESGPYLGQGHKLICDAALSAEVGMVCSMYASTVTLPVDDLQTSEQFREYCLYLGGLVFAILAGGASQQAYNVDQCLIGCNVQYSQHCQQSRSLCISNCGWTECQTDAHCVTLWGPNYECSGTNHCYYDDPTQFQCYTDPDCWILLGPGSVCFEGICSYFTPIIVDTSGDGYYLTDVEHGVVFNLTGRGPDRISWTDARGGNAFLALDRNANDTIDDGTELFGASTPQALVPGIAPNGFRALAIYDSAEYLGNGNGFIDPMDAVYWRLLLWQDENQNGVSEAQELHRLPEFDITAIHLDYRESRHHDEHGNWFRYRSFIIERDGRPGRRSVFDVILQHE
jgi:hypothetical protein